MSGYVVHLPMTFKYVEKYIYVWFILVTLAHLLLFKWVKFSCPWGCSTWQQSSSKLFFCSIWTCQKLACNCKELASREIVRFLGVAFLFAFSDAWNRNGPRHPDISYWHRQIDGPILFSTFGQRRRSPPGWGVLQEQGRASWTEKNKFWFGHLWHFLRVRKASSATKAMYSSSIINVLEFNVAGTQGGGAGLWCPINFATQVEAPSWIRRAETLQVKRESFSSFEGQWLTCWTCLDCCTLLTEPRLTRMFSTRPFLPSFAPSTRDFAEETGSTSGQGQCRSPCFTPRVTTMWLTLFPLLCPRSLVDGRVAGHLGAADGLKTSSIHVCVCPHFGM